MTGSNSRRPGKSEGLIRDLKTVLLLIHRLNTQQKWHFLSKVAITANCRYDE